MSILEIFSSLLGSVMTPLILFVSALIMIPSVRLFKVLRPRSFFRALTDNPKNSSTTPFRALSVALAGTLGVGNITGVASALIAGGPGAIFWMWMGALAVLAVKYAEVYLAVRYRKRDENRWIGGAMYYIRDGLGKRFPQRFCKIAAGFFAVLCCLNSLITGNLVQANAAVSVIPKDLRFICGIIFGFFVMLAILYGTKRVEHITSLLIPPLTLIYMILAFAIIWSNRALLSDIFHEIVSSAFTLRAAAGGVGGFTLREAVRFGIMRGIFSNEAGCGTSPTAHASADTKSPHHQACLGIVEVVFDTIILCSLTAFVLLIADKRYLCIPWRDITSDSAEVTLESFRFLAGDAVYYILVVSIIMFAYATILAQLYYGTVALRYLSNKKGLQIAYSAMSVTATVVGSVVSAPIVWLSADLIIGMMTAVNCIVIILLRKDCRDELLR